MSKDILKMEKRSGNGGERVVGVVFDGAGGVGVRYEVCFSKFLERSVSGRGEVERGFRVR